MLHLPPPARHRALARFGALFIFAAIIGGCEEPLDPDTDTLSPADPSYAIGDLDVTDSWIVVFRDDVTDPGALAASLVVPAGGEVRSVYRHVFKGFAARMPEAAALALLNNPNVRHVEADQVVPGPDHVQQSAPWHLDRVDQRGLTLDGLYHYFWTGGGSSVTIYVIDTGVTNHTAEFGGRLLTGVSFVNDGHGTSDCNNHGTGVASVAAGDTLGVAKQAWIRSVRIGDCNGSTTTARMVDGLNWVAANHIKPAVANLSWSLGGSFAIDWAAIGLVNAGVLLVTSAGQSGGGVYPPAGDDACNYSPNRSSAAITVAATNSNDSRAVWPIALGGYESSNWGSCVDIWAPGRTISIATNTGGYGTVNGTSFAAPAVAGAIALILDEDPNRTAQQARNWLYSRATSTTIGDAGAGSPHLMLYVPSFRVAIGGPSPITENGQYEWTAVHHGGGHHAPDSYLWEYMPFNDPNWQVVGTAQTYVRHVSLADWDFFLRVTATVGTFAVDRDRHIIVGAEPCDPSDPLCPQ